MVMNDIVMKKTKLGFSLMEACVVMLIASIFIVVMANVIPRKVSKKSMAEAHGRFECYWSGTDLYQNEFNSGASVYNAVKASTKDGGSSIINGVSGPAREYCKFSPNKYAKYYIINAVGAGGLGDADSSGIGGDAGKFNSSFTPAFTGHFKLYPGKVRGKVFTPADANKSNSYVTDSSGKVILYALGANNSGFDTVNDIEDCQFVKVTNVERYDCGRTPTCSISNGKLSVNRCINQEKYTSSKSLPMSDDKSMNCLDTSGSVGRLYNETTGKYIAYNKKPSANLGNCDYKALKSNPWIYQPDSTTLLYPDVELALPIPHNQQVKAWTPRTDTEKLPSLYTMKLTRIAEAETSAGAISSMETMAKVFSYSSALTDFSSGSGGAAGKTISDPPQADGKGGPAPGAVVVTW